MGSRFTDKGEKALNDAVKIAESFGHTYIGSEHVLMALCTDQLSCSYAILAKCGVTRAKIESGIKEFTGTGTKSTLSAKDMTPRCRRIVESSYKHSLKYSAQKIGTEHILLALLDQKESVAVKILEHINTDTVALKDETVTFLRSSERLSDGKKGNGQIPFLTQYARNLNDLARRGNIDPVVGRDQETERLIRILLRRNKNNPCLIGEAGVGKTAIVEGLAAKIVSGDVPEALRNKVIYSVDLTSMIAGAKYRGDFEDRIKSIIAEASKNEFVILFIDEIHTIVGAGSAEGAIDAANILKPELSRSNIQLIGATTLTEYRKYIEKDPALERRFQPLTVEEASQDTTVRILRELKEKYEKHHNVAIDDAALLLAVKLSEVYIHDRHLPDKALDLIDEACAKVSLKHSHSDDKISEIEENIRQTVSKKEDAVKSRNFALASELHEIEQRYTEELYNLSVGKEDLRPRVTEEDIRGVVTEITGIPLGSLSDGINYELPREKLSCEILGQENAVDQLAAAVMRSSIGIGNPEKPKGIFMFSGESGVGKSALAKALAEALFSSKSSFIRLDMSEFREPHSVSKLIGSPPGYVGFDEGGMLTERVRRHPYSVVLFDEIEKAADEVLDLLLQVMDDGSLTDSSGRRVSFRNTYIVLTTNVTQNADGTAAGTGFITQNTSDSGKALYDALKKHFRPEFLNRIDEIIPFSSLSEETLAGIAKIQLKRLSERLMAQNIKLCFTDSVYRRIAALGKRINKGARPIARLISGEIETPLSTLLLKNKGLGTILVDEKDGKIIFEEKKSPEPITLGSGGERK